VDATAGSGLPITLSGTDLDGDPLTFNIATAPTKGQLSGTSPNLVYTPGSGSTGTDSFSYAASDGTVQSAPGFVTIRINTSNHAPIAKNLALNAVAGQALSIELSATDLDGDALTYSIVSNPAHGQILGNPPHLTYTATESFSGTDLFTYVARDPTAQSAPATVTIDVKNDNHAPIPAPLTYNQTGDGPIGITLQGIDADGDPLSYSILTFPLLGQLSGTPPNLSYVPGPGASGTDTFTYSVTDGISQSGSATVTINLGTANHVPNTASLAVNTVQNQAIVINLTGIDDDGDALTYYILTPPHKGQLSGSPPSVTYTPSASANGDDSFTYVVTDGKAQSSPGFVSIHIEAAQNIAPTATDLTFDTVEDQALKLLLAGMDPQGKALTYSVLTQPTHGQLSGTPPDLTYTPAPEANGFDSFTYGVNNGQTQSAPATVTIHIAPVNDIPIANDLNLNAAPNVPLSFSLSGTDPDGDALSFAIVTPPAHGQFSGVAPALVYTPATGFSGIDTFTYRASDGSADSAPATVRINVVPQNHSPLASPLSVQTTSGQSVNILLTGTDPDGDSLSFKVVSPPSAGQLSGVGANLTYSPAANFAGTDSLRYSVNDGALSSEAVVTITVLPSNRPPVSSNISLTAVAGVPLAITLGGSDLDGDPVTFQIVDAPSKGQLSGTAPHLIYTASPFGNGRDIFTYRVSDGKEQSALGTVSIDISGGTGVPTPTTSIRLTQDQNIVLSLVGPPNHAYQIEYSTDAAHWLNLSSGSADNDGNARYTESLPIEHVTLYRVRWP
jgi:hypothetical protein